MLVGLHYFWVSPLATSKSKQAPRSKTATAIWKVSIPFGQVRLPAKEIRRATSRSAAQRNNKDSRNNPRPPSSVRCNNSVPSRQTQDQNHPTTKVATNRLGNPIAYTIISAPRLPHDVIFANERALNQQRGSQKT